MEEKRLTPIKAIRAKCLDCCCWQKSEVKLCPVQDCALYPYRMGHNPYIKRKSKSRIDETMLAQKAASRTAKEETNISDEEFIDNDISL